MSLKLKVYGGTTTENICLKCAYLREIQGVRESDCIRFCGAQNNHKIPFPVARCSFYHEKDPDLSRYRNALELLYDKKKRQLLILESRGIFENKYVTVEEYRAALKEAPEQQPKTRKAVN